MESIDKSQFLPPRASIVNPHRLAKGDLDGKVEVRHIEGKKQNVITHAHVKDASILSELIERGYLEKHHLMYGCAFMEIRKAYFSVLDYKMNCVFLEFLNGGDVSGSQAAKMYLEVIKDLKVSNADIIELACNEKAENEPGLDKAFVCNAYRDCFELLVKLLDQARDKLKQESEKGIANE